MKITTMMVLFIVRIIGEGAGEGFKYMRDDHDGDDSYYCICITLVMMTKSDLPIVSVAVMTCIAPRSI